MTSLFSHNQISVEDLRSADPRLRLRAIKNLPTISSAIGKERTRNELLPFITSIIEDEDEENLIELTKVISNFIDYVGGKQYVLHILKFYENLLQLDEFLLRYEVVKAIKTIFASNSPYELENSIIDIISKLLSVDSVHNKLSIIVLIPLILPYASNNNKNNLTQLFLKLSMSDNVYVKREASLNAKDLAGVIDEESYMKILTIFIKDPNDNIRVNIIDSLVVLRNHKNPIKFTEFIIGCFNMLVNDESWRIRYTFADKIHEVLNLLKQFLNFINFNSNTKATLIEVIAKYLEDTEAEVRNICCKRLENISEKMAKEETFDKILKKLKNYENESVLYVKENFAKHVLRICPYINKLKIQEFVIPTFLSLINEENHNIRLGILKNVDKLNEVITLDIFNQYILPAFLSISTNKNWRIRIQVTESLPVIAKIVNREIFLKTLLNISLKWISDDVYAIREEGCKVLKKLFDYFKCDEFEKRLIEKLTELKNDVNYLRRNIVLILIREFVNDNIYNDFLERSLLPFVIAMSKDKVCNIRMSCVLILRKVQKTLKNNSAANEIKNILEELRKDNDFEVVNALIDDL